MLSSTPAPAEATSPAAAGDEEEDMEDQPSSSSAPEDATSPVAADAEDEDMIDQPSSPVEVPQNEPEAPDGMFPATWLYTEACSSIFDTRKWTFANMRRF